MYMGMCVCVCLLLAFLSPKEKPYQLVSFLVFFFSAKELQVMLSETRRIEDHLMRPSSH